MSVKTRAAGLLAPVGNTVDTSKATFTKSIGAEQLDFQPLKVDYNRPIYDNRDPQAPC